MTGPFLDRELRSFLLGAGFRPSAPGPAGALWWPTASPQRDLMMATETRNFSEAVAVPNGLRAGTPEWSAIVTRLANASGQPIALLDYTIRHRFLDVADLRAANDVLIDGTIPLSAGRTMVESAFYMLRAAATTARGAKAHISGGYLKLADQTVAEARMGHTRQGSYIIPILMPIPPDNAEQGDGGSLAASQPTFDGLDPALLRPEPMERRTTRTFAQALAAVSRFVVEPAVEPRAGLVAPLVTAGVSREFVTALKSIVEDPSVSTLRTSFSWAGGVPASTDLPTEVIIPADAAYNLGVMAQHLKRSKREPVQSITGPIVEWHLRPGDQTGYIGVQTVRGGRETTVLVYLPADETTRAIDYARSAKTVVVYGEPVGGRGKRVQITGATRVRSLEEMMLQDPPTD